ncbi:M24 family metallopeptidase [Actinomadura chibensis]|uniref:M24 family metallopeptidase n=1 Tax=Actinomadura chibensis TaxID=392828 RepID=A0A5D0NU71_9ACTN|nr:M24 family metallopeptidase [Actinomadura chibensis]TYB48173.1 M24 family metallopeptidase [Actinomadura chibensis]
MPTQIIAGTASEDTAADGPGRAHDEREFRMRRTREFMDEQGLDALLVFGADRSDRYDAGQYLFRDRRYQHFVVPRDGEPTMVAFAAQVAAQHMLTRERGLQTWIDDIRVGPGPELLPAIVREKGLAAGRLGVIGAGYGSPFYPGGWVSKPVWDAVSERLPDAELVDVTRDYGLVMARRSDEDLEHLATAAAAGDAAIEAMMAAARPGVDETALYAEGIAAMLRRGMRVTWMLFQTGLDNYAWGEPTWLTRPEPARVLGSADMVWAEIFPNYAELNTHVNMSFTVGTPPAETLRCAEVARASYEAGRAALRPGATFADVCAAMEEPLTEAGMWHLTPQLASLNPLLSGGGSGLGIREQVPSFAGAYPHADGHAGPFFDFEILPGMTFSLQPDARLGRHGAIVGGVVAATETGCREFNTVSTRLNSVDG